MPETQIDAATIPLEHKSVLDTAALKTPHLALASLKREVLRMMQVTESMAAPVMDLYKRGDSTNIAIVRVRTTSLIERLMAFAGTLLLCPPMK